MGNHRLRLSDMMPNAWFNKLSQPQRNQPMPTKKTTNPQAQAPPNHHLLQPLIPNRDFSSPLHPKAFDTHFPFDSPRKSTTHKQPRRMIPAIITSSTTSSSSSSLSISSSCRGSVSDSDSDVHSSYCISTKNDVTAAAFSQLDLELELELPSIITKPAKKVQTAAEETTVDVKPKKAAPAIRRLRMRTSSTSPRTRTRTSSAAAEKVRVVRKKSGLSESFAVVKSTSDPRSDFRESMMEMIVENGLSSSNELEDLLACYLSLNSNEYHHVIVGVFEEIWFDISSDFVRK
ncbi:transcription repressor OFP2-like [Iris pallida]|uniref:Transcription repressor n=1 Tax=Iris pallida TaxID=29817 RepID=A0AAX6GSB5_IRIPA|nr:transcription repressor OFP2-like [Iris pallida]